MAEDQYADVGRNDPCPCGSGKKYKKCHYQKDLVRKQAAESTVSLDTFVKADQPPYLFWKGLRTIVNRRDWNLLYEAFAPDGALANKYSDVEAFVEVARGSASRAPTGGDDYELRRFHALGDDVFIMGVRGRENRRSTSAEYEVIAARNTDAGYRIHDVELLSVEKTDELEDPPFSDFQCFSTRFEEARNAPVERPEFLRWTLDGPPPEYLEAEAKAAEAAAEAE